MNRRTELLKEIAFAPNAEARREIEGRLKRFELTGDENAPPEMVAQVQEDALITFRAPQSRVTVDNSASVRSYRSNMLRKLKAVFPFEKGFDAKTAATATSVAEGAMQRYLETEARRDFSQIAEQSGMFFIVSPL